MKKYKKDQLAMIDSNAQYIRDNQPSKNTMDDVYNAILKSVQNFEVNTCMEFSELVIESKNDVINKQQALIDRLKKDQSNINKCIEFMLKEYFGFVKETIESSDIKYKVQLELTLTEIANDLHHIARLTKQ